jgi:hypothetical protein
LEQEHDGIRTIAGELGFEDTQAPPVDESENWPGLFGWLKAIWEAIVNFFKGAVDFFNNILSYLNPWSENFFLRIAFVPKEGFMTRSFDKFKTEVFAKFHIDEYVQSLEQLGGSRHSGGTFGAVVPFGADSSGGGVGASLNVYGVGAVSGEIVNVSFFEKHKNDIFNIMRAFMIVFIILFNINQIYAWLNRGATVMASHNVQSMIRPSGKKGGDKD